MKTWIFTAEVTVSASTKVVTDDTATEEDARKLVEGRSAQIQRNHRGDDVWYSWAIEDADGAPASIVLERSRPATKSDILAASEYPDENSAVDESDADFASDGEDEEEEG